MSRRKIAVTVGILFFVQMVTAMVGTSLIQAFVDGDTDEAPLTAGVLLMMSFRHRRRRHRPSHVSGS